MPSGSHGGSPGSHFSGGSHSSSSFGGSSRSYSRGPRPISHHHVVIFGRPYIYTRGGNYSSLLSIFIFTIVFGIMIFAGGIFVNISSNNYVHKMEQDYEYYQDMIDYANIHPEYKHTAVVKNKFMSDYEDKWYFTYDIPCLTCIGNTLEGYTYSIYTKEEIREFQVGTVIEVATDSIVVSEDTDSIPMDYKNKPLTDDGEYISNKKSIKGSIIAIVVSSLLIIGSIMGMVLVFKKTLKREKNVTSATSEVEIEKTNYCPYCNQALEKGQTKCPNCGAGIRR